MNKGNRILVTCVVAVIGFLLGLGVNEVLPVLQKSRLGVVNVSGYDLRDVVVRAGDDRQTIGVIPSGQRQYVTPDPDDSADLVVEFTCSGRRYQAVCGAIGPRREQRTATILEDGKQVIVSFGDSDAAASLYHTELITPGGAP